MSQYKLVSTKMYFLSKLSESGTVNRRKRKGKRETTRRRIKSEKIKKVSILDIVINRLRLTIIHTKVHIINLFLIKKEKGSHSDCIFKIFPRSIFDPTAG